MRLFSYCIPVDDGAAPNPYWGICTLAICKPKIRSVAQVGDWIAGVGSKDVRGVSYENKLVYAMKVTQKMTLKEYDVHCRNQLPNKIPDIDNAEYSRRVGDSIYDYSTIRPTLRKSVHNELNECRDLGGKYVLLSNHFYYFGDQAIDIPFELLPIVNQRQGHKSNANEPYKLDFIDWLERSNYKPNTLYGQSQILINFSKRESFKNCEPEC